MSSIAWRHAAHLTGRHFFIESSRRSAKRGQWIAKPRRKSLVRSIPPSGARQTLSVGPDTCPVSAHNLAARAPESQSHSRLSCGGYFLGHHPCDFRLSCRAAGSDLQKPQCNDLLCFHAQPRCLRHQIQPTPEQSTSPSVLYERHRGRLGPTSPTSRQTKSAISNSSPLRTAR